MTRLTDERLKVMRSQLREFYYGGGHVQDDVAALLDEVDRSRGFEFENDELWADLARLQSEVELLRTRPGATPVVAAPRGTEVLCRECGGLGFHRVGNTDRTVYCSCSTVTGGKT